MAAVRRQQIPEKYTGPSRRWRYYFNPLAVVCLLEAQLVAQLDNVKT